MADSDIVVRHEIGGSTLEAALNGLASKIDSLSGVGGSPKLGDAVNGIGATNKDTTTPLTKQITTLSQQTAKLADILKKSIELQKQSMRSGVDVANARREANRELYSLKQRDRQELYSLRQRDRQDYEDSIKRIQNNSRRNKFANIGLGAVTGMAFAATYQAGAYGRIVGSQANSVNTPYNNYDTFSSQYANKKIAGQAGMAQTGMMAGLGGAIAITSMINPILGALTAVVGGVATAITNYEVNKKAVSTQALNTLAGSQDMLAYRLRATGISSKMSRNSLNINNGFFSADQKVPLTQLQNYMVQNSDKYGYALPNLGAVALNSQRDIFAGLGKRGQADFVAQATNTSISTGADVAAISKNASVMAAMTGANPTALLKKLTDDNKQYGGDMVNNTAKIVQLLQTTSLSPNEARNLVNKYQNNPAYMQSQAAQHRITPLNSWLGRIEMKLGGASAEEIKAGEWNEAHKRKYRAMAKAGKWTPQMSFMTGSAGLLSQDLYATNAGAIKPTTGGKDQQTALQEAFKKMIADSLSNISVGAQTVTAQSVNVSGAVYFGAGSLLNAQSNNIQHTLMKAKTSGTGHLGDKH